MQVCQAYATYDCTRKSDKDSQVVLFSCPLAMVIYRPIRVLYSDNLRFDRPGSQIARESLNYTEHVVSAQLTECPRRCRTWRDACIIRMTCMTRCIATHHESATPWLHHCCCALSRNVTSAYTVPVSCHFRPARLNLFNCQRRKSLSNACGRPPSFLAFSFFSFTPSFPSFPLSFLPHFPSTSCPSTKNLWSWGRSKLL